MDRQASRKRRFCGCEKSQEIGHWGTDVRQRTYLRDIFQQDGAVDGDISPNAEPDEGGDDEQRRVIVRKPKTEAKRAGEEAGQVERPTTTCQDTHGSLVNSHFGRVSEGIIRDGLGDQPTMSDISPQNMAPAVRPALKLVEIFPDWLSSNPISCWTGLRTRPKA